jgi:hypothetical protein
VLGIWDWIKNKDPELKIAAANYALDWIGQVPGKRESRRIIGEYFMTEHDPLKKTVFHDEAAYGGWFIDLHEAGGLLADYSELSLAEGEQGAYAAKSYVGPYGIPLRVMIAKGMNNLMMAGRNVSVTHAALGTVRVQGTTAVMGQAAGTAAAVAVRHRRPVREIPADAALMREVQQILLREDCFLPNAVNEDPLDLARSAQASASSEALLRGAETPAGNRDEADRLGRRRGQWIAVGGPRIDALAVCVTNDADAVQPLAMKLYAVEHIWDYRVEPGKPLAETVLMVEPGRKQWVEWPVSLDTARLRGGYVRLDLPANPHLIWHTADKVEPGHVSAYDLLNGQMRRFDKGVTQCFRVAPAQACYGAAQVLSGVARPYRFTNLWRSNPEHALPQHLELSWRRPVRVGRIELRLPGQLLRDYRAYPEFYRDPQCPRDLRAEAWSGGEWREIGAVTGNYRRRVAFVPAAPVTTERIRITVLATNGDPSAAIYEIRCYER